MSKREIESQSVSNIQKYLRQLSYDDGNIPRVAVDGIYGSETENAVRAFQRVCDKDPTGVTDEETFNELYSAYRKSLDLHSPPKAMCVFPRFPSGYAAIEGDESFLITAVQFMLSELFNSYGIFDGGVEQTGIFDGNTLEAVKMFQSLNKLSESGRIDKETWDRLAGEYNDRFGNQISEM